MPKLILINSELVINKIGIAMKEQVSMNKPQAALAALQEKYPEGIADIHVLNDEQKAWIEMKIRAITEVGS